VGGLPFDGKKEGGYSEAYKKKYFTIRSPQGGKKATRWGLLLGPKKGLNVEKGELA